MNTSFFSSSKFFYLLIGGIIFIVFVTILLFLRNVGGGTGNAQASLEFWGVYDDRQTLTALINAFKGAEPGIKVNYRQFSYADYEKSLIDALASGTGPDLIMIDNTWLAKHRDILSPMPATSGSKTVQFFTLSDFQKQFVDVVSKDLVYQDKIYAIPLYVDTLALFYNKDMFNTAGITAPPKTWEDFNNDVELLTKFDTKDNIIQAGAAMGTARNVNRSSDILSELMIQNGTKMTNETNTAATFTRSVNSTLVGENALQYYTDFANPAKKVYTWNDDQHYSIDAFVEGSLAMMFNYSHQIPVVQGRFNRLNFGIAPVPQFSELNTKNFASYWAVGVSAQSKNQNAAWRFLNYLGSHDGSLAYVTAASRPSARRDIIDVQRNDPKLGVFAVQALSAKSWYQVDNNAIDQIFADMIDDVNLKRQALKSAIRSAESKVNTLMTKSAYPGP